MKIPTEHLFEKTNICSPRYTYTLSTEKLIKNLLLKNSLKAKRYTYTDFSKSFPKVGENREKCVHRANFQKTLNYKNLNFQKIPIVKANCQTILILPMNCQKIMTAYTCVFCREKFSENYGK